MEIDPFVERLHTLLATDDPMARYELAMTWSKAVFEESAQIGDEMSDEILSDLAFDLTLYEPDPQRRAEDLSYFDDVELERRVREAIHQLEGSSL